MQKSLAVVLLTAMFATPALAQSQSSVAPAAIGQFVRGLTPGTHIKLKLVSGARVKGILIATEDDAVIDLVIIEGSSTTAAASGST